MCGICGYISKQHIDDSKLKSMRDTMQHRGPNDAGIWQSKLNGYNVGLAHRRLSIIDLSSKGHQPMLSDDEKIVIVFNGEIYNYYSLRRELTAKGYLFKSESDTEVILAAYKEFGVDCVRRFNGMFALAIYDSEKAKIILYRDRIGKKPLYYYYNKSTNEFVFASELKPIMEYPYFSKNIRIDTLGFFMCNKYIAAPNTIFENTFKMIPGTFLIYDICDYSNNKIVVKKYWDLIEKNDSVSKNEMYDFHEGIYNLDVVLNNAVADRLIADVPVGCFLSGGYDSALIAAIAQRKRKEPLKTYTIGFYDKRNEAVFSKQIASYLGTDHKELYISEEETLRMVKDLPFFFDEPFSDSSQIPTMLVSQLAADDIKVVLSGDGGDEVFCGYKMYDWTYIAQHFDVIGEFMNGIPYMDLIKTKLSPELRAFINNRNPMYKCQLYIDVMEEMASKLLGCGLNTKFDVEKKLKHDNWQEARMILDMITYLPDEILAKTDRATMKYSIEGRCPFVDHRVIEQSFRIPQKYKYHNFEKKYIIKELTYKYLPQNLMDRPKQGFSIPLAKWLRTVLKSEINRYAEQDYVNKQGIFNYSELNKLILLQEKSNKIMYSSMLWSYYVFQRWFEQYIGL